MNRLPPFLHERPRRLRRNPALRDLLREVDVRLVQLIQPYFLKEKPGAPEPISGFTGISRYANDDLSRRIEKDVERGVKHFLLFAKAAHKSELGTEAYDEKGAVPQALRELKKRFGQSAVFFTDVCLCPFTTHGHCGIVDGAEVDNDKSLAPLARMAVAHARAGADFVAPSDMMDGRVGAIREALDLEGLTATGILAYTAKYASSYYGPFREALDSAPTGAAGADRATYQMDFRRSTEALRELRLDRAEGADMVMVKPALAYLDIIAAFRRECDLPVVAYSVSGEYQAAKLLAANGLADERKLVVENLTAIVRVGAHAVITYHASEAAEKGWLK